MKKLLPLPLVFLLFSCSEANLEDLNKFVVDTKSKVYPVKNEVPTLKKIDTLNFTQAEGRNPFSQPKLEVVAEVKDTPKSCPQPNFEREKQALELYSLGQMQMRGTLLKDGELSALVQISGNEVHRVKPGNYLGLNYGKVLKINKDQIDLLELAPDQNGCWEERLTQIKLVSK
ncbi:pilus assembly protein PilP [Psychromonas sp. B3M02]|uniref:pilus assembly protein PilP n=1 Tax=unclassified Psychromonas TaxID=2614957 RepID=UPI000DE9CA95|nr:pilus assembly protein PilP [Psychromonas sp. B3M02]RBW45119.1 pilus assembly protein PilP [Psychromonas sp. B3M02]